MSREVSRLIWALSILSFLFFCVILFRAEISGFLSRAVKGNISIGWKGIDIEVESEKMTRINDYLTSQLNQELDRSFETFGPVSQLQLPDNDNEIQFLTELIPKEIIKKDLGVTVRLSYLESIRRNLSKLLQLQTEVLNVAREDGNRIDEGNALNEISKKYYDMGELDSAYVYLQMALDIHREENYISGEANQLNGLGLVYRAQGNLPRALDYHIQALAIYGENNLRKGEGIALGNIGLVYHVLGEKERKYLDTALVFYDSALQIHQLVSDSIGIQKHLGNIGLIFYKKKNYMTAQEYFKRALVIAQEINYRRGEAYHLENIGLIYNSIDKLDSALLFLNLALEINKEIGNLLGAAQQIGNIGIVYESKKELNQARTYVILAVQIFKDGGYARESAFYEDVLSDLDSKISEL